MNAEELLAQVEALGVTVDHEGDVLAFRPGSAVPPALVEELRAHKPELLELVSLRGWPEASREAVRRFRRPEARLYPLMGHRVATPEGVGRLLAALPGLAAVRLEPRPPRTVYLLASEVRPVGLERRSDGSFDPCTDRPPGFESGDTTSWSSTTP